MSKKRLAAAILVTVAAAAAFVLALNPGLLRFFRHELEISIAGDVMLDRGVAEKIAQNGAAYPFEGVKKLFKQDDITVANLECALTTRVDAALKEFVFKAEPKSAETLKSAGFDAMMLANNHTMDYLSAGLSDTMKALEGEGILYAGAGQKRGEIRPCFIEKNGLRIGVLSYSEFLPEHSSPDAESAAIAYVSARFIEDMQKDIRQAASECDFLIVYFHWGIEYLNDVSDEQKEIAHAAVDSGASLVVGTHPHVLQGREAYKGVPIYYSVGNFVFDRQDDEGTDEAVILQLKVGKKGIVTEKALPVVIEKAKPRLVEGERVEQIKANLVWHSRGLE